MATAVADWQSFELINFQQLRPVLLIGSCALVVERFANTGQLRQATRDSRFRVNDWCVAGTQTKALEALSP